MANTLSYHHLHRMVKSIAVVIHYDHLHIELKTEDVLYGDTFDFVTIQLYEGYSHAEYNTTIEGVPAAEYLVKFVSSIVAGWTVDFSTGLNSSLFYNDSSLH